MPHIDLIREIAEATLQMAGEFAADYRPDSYGHGEVVQAVVANYAEHGHLSQRDSPLEPIEDPRLSLPKRATGIAERQVQPVRPDDLTPDVGFPDTVIATWNQLIAEHWRNGVAKVPKGLALGRIMEATKLNQAEVEGKEYLHVTTVYNAAGWNVEFKTETEEGMPPRYFMVFTRAAV